MRSSHVLRTILLIGLIAILPACGNTDHPTDAVAPSDALDSALHDPQQKTGDERWNLLFYVAADNSLEDGVETFLSSLEKADLSDDGVTTLALVDRLSTPGTPIYHLQDGARTLVADWEERNTADPSVLEDFLALAADLYPGQNTVLVMKGPGFAWRGFGLDETDEEAVMGVHDLAGTLKGHPVDVLAFDASYMGLLETAYELRNTATAMVATQSTITSGGIPGDLLLSIVGGNSQISPRELAVELVEGYASVYSSDFATLAACDLTRIGAVGEAFSAVTELLVDQMRSNRTIIAPARDHSEIGLNDAVMSSEYLHDLHVFFGDLLAIEDPELQATIEQLLSSFADAILAEGHAPRYRDVPHGLSFWFPPSLEKWDCDAVTYDGQFHYEECDLDLVADSRWVDCLMSYYRTAKHQGKRHQN